MISPRRAADTPPTERPNYAQCAAGAPHPGHPPPQRPEPPQRPSRRKASLDIRGPASSPSPRRKASPKPISSSDRLSIGLGLDPALGERPPPLELVSPPAVVPVPPAGLRMASAGGGVPAPASCGIGLCGAAVAPGPGTWFGAGDGALLSVPGVLPASTTAPPPEPSATGAGVAPLAAKTEEGTDEGAAGADVGASAAPCARTSFAAKREVAAGEVAVPASSTPTSPRAVSAPPNDRRRPGHGNPLSLERRRLSRAASASVRVKSRGRGGVGTRLVALEIAPRSAKSSAQARQSVTRAVARSRSTASTSPSYRRTISIGSCRSWELEGSCCFTVPRRPQPRNSSRSRSSFWRRARRPRWIRDFTVPRELPMIRAISP